MFTNEAHCILDTIKSTLPYAYEYILLDNNSTDNTVALCEALLNDNSMKYQVFRTEWVDFGHNYSYLYELGHKHSDADYIWQIDADDLVHGTMNIEDLTDDAYKVVLRGGGLHYYRNQIFSNKLLWKHYLKIHGYVSTYPKKEFKSSILEGDYYIQCRHEGSRHKIDMKTKYLNDANMLQEDLLIMFDQDDRNRCYFYLAQSYYCASEYQKAIEIYKRRIEQCGWQEEVWYSRLQIARCYKYLKDDENTIKSYRECYDYHPCYAEAVFELGVYYAKMKNYKGAQNMLEIAVNKPFPTDKFLFLSKDIYDYHAKLWLAVVYYYVNEYNKSYNINMSLLKQSLSDHVRIIVQDNNKWNYDIILNDVLQVKQYLKNVDPRMNNYEVYYMALKYGSIKVIQLIKHNIIERNWYERQVFNVIFKQYGVHRDLNTYYRHYYLG